MTIRNRDHDDNALLQRALLTPERPPADDNDGIAIIVGLVAAAFAALMLVTL